VDNSVKTSTAQSKRILAVASTGGHWEQMMMLAPAFEGGIVTFACTDAAQAKRYDFERFEAIKDYNQDEPLKLMRGLFETFLLIAKIRPHVVISTGAAPGLLCLLWGRVFFARTIWVDSIANSEQMSLSGKLAKRFCHTVLTQWEHLAKDEGPTYRGSVI
jgi:UDP-N-acetylglucosamine:LPS N-acetylglucosamine transferase